MRLCLSLLSISLLLPAGANADLYFSEYIEGASNNKALEIANTSGDPQPLDGYQVQFFYNGNASAGLTLSLSGTLAADDVYVLAQSSADPAILAEADLTNGSGWFNGDDAIALVRDGDVLDVIGQIGGDPGSQWGSGDTSTQNNTLRRKTDITQGDIDGSDAFDPAAEWDGFAQDTFDGLGLLDGNGGTDPEPPLTGQCGDPATRLHAIQGDGEASPLADTPVSVEAVVVGLFQGSDALGGFFLQERDTLIDDDPNTSEGLFVYTGNTTHKLAMGDLVRVSGSVSEYYEMTQLDNVASVEVCAQGLSVSSAELSLPVSDRSELEALESMRVSIAQPLTVNENYNLGRYGELLLSSERHFTPTQVAEPGAAANAVADAQALDRVILDDGSTVQNPPVVPYPAPELGAYNTVRSGDQVVALTGVMAYGFSEYRVHPVQAPTFMAANPRPSAPSLPGKGNLTVAAFNVLNYFNGDGQGGGFPTSRGADSAEEFERQRAKIIQALATMNADIVGLVEIENDGYGADSAIADLVEGLSEAGVDYTYVDPGVNAIGTDAIAVGFLYRPDRVALEGDAAILDGSVDSRFVDTKNRPVLAQSFEHSASGEVLTLAVAHLKSKGSDCDDLGDPDQNDGQGNCNQTRTLAAQAMADWLASDPTGSGDPDTLILGDLNAYALEDPIDALKAAGYTDLPASFSQGTTYSYVFDGKAGHLDHALASESLAEQVTGATQWAINADEPRILDYNTEYKTPSQVVTYYSDELWRSSDHDPVLVELQLDTPVAGDFTGNDRLDLWDMLALIHQFRRPVTDHNTGYDLDGNRRIDARDLKQWKYLWREQKLAQWRDRRGKATWAWRH
ncbi:ExeM/NucH family extracellular endonuclease [Marinimicrobium agarilyticum]|uniref:ExeM/NucH family extracellular endonuclease n=1 Tax=Marinimicrobium agarilyticum TaxID=306546 RepID=UPI000406CA5F|nr:ExeM/NucH family extracellular endonuclease [Marinimicrobium agarilyticum]